MDLGGRNVLITGANRGVGASFVTTVLGANAGTVYAGARKVESVAPQGDQVVPVELDVTDLAQVQAAAATATDLDLLIINAGVTCIMPAISTPDTQAFRDTMEVNFFGTMNLLRSFADTLKARQGGVIMVLSTASVALSRSAPLYSSSKAAALMLGLGVREELKDDGVTLTMCLPGFIKTTMSEKMIYPKAEPIQIAERALGGWLAGEPTVWPDRFAEMVGERIGAPMNQLLDAPREVMNEVTQAFLVDPKAGF